MLEIASIRASSSALVEDPQTTLNASWMWEHPRAQKTRKTRTHDNFFIAFIFVGTQPFGTMDWIESSSTASIHQSIKKVDRLGDRDFYLDTFCHKGFWVGHRENMSYQTGVRIEISIVRIIRCSCHHRIPTDR